jgi:hypothetical protein
MLTLNFIIEPEYILWHTLTNIGDNKFTITEEDPVKFRVENFQDDNTGLTEIMYEYPEFDKSIRTGFTFNMYEETIESDDFKEIVNDVERSKRTLETEWQKYSQKINNFLLELGINVQASYNIYLSHPALIKDKNRYQNFIPWVVNTHSPFESMLGLVEQNLRLFFAEYYSNNESTHALVQVLIYEELGTKLLGTKYSFPETDTNMLTIIHQIRPRLQEYIKKHSTEIEKLVNECEVLAGDLT